MARAKFTDTDGLIVFEQQPSGTLGVAAPDGSHARMLDGLGALQGNDLPVASPDGRYLVTDEAQIVTLGPHGPRSIAFMPAATDLQTTTSSWQGVSFADGGRYVTAQLCANNNNSPYWWGRLVPVAGGGGSDLSTVDGVYGAQSLAGDPRSAGAFAVPGPAQNPQSVESCAADQLAPPSGGDQSVVLESPGRKPRLIVTVATVRQALGIAPGTPELLAVYPSPDGSQLAVMAASFRMTGRGLFVTSQGVAVLSRTGKVLAVLRGDPGYLPRWSPDGRQLAFALSAGVLVWPVAGTARTIPLRGHQREYFTQLLWSPDGRQIACAGQHLGPGLTAAATLQHGWTVIDLPNGGWHDVSAPGQPAAWLPAQGSAR